MWLLEVVNFRVNLCSKYVSFAVPQHRFRFPRPMRASLDEDFVGRRLISFITKRSSGLFDRRQKDRFLTCIIDLSPPHVAKIHPVLVSGFSDLIAAIFGTVRLSSFDRPHRPT